MNTTSKFNFRYRSLLGVCMLGTAAAWANPPGGSMTVSYRDLDLNNSAGGLPSSIGAFKAQRRASAATKPHPFTGQASGKTAFAPLSTLPLPR